MNESLRKLSSESTRSNRPNSATLPAPARPPRTRGISASPNTRTEILLPASPTHTISSPTSGIPRSSRHATNLADSNSILEIGQNYEVEVQIERERYEETSRERRLRNDSSRTIKPQQPVTPIYDIFNNYLEEPTDQHMESIADLTASPGSAGRIHSFESSIPSIPHFDSIPPPPLMVLPPSPRYLGRISQSHAPIVQPSYLKVEEDNNGSSGGSNYSGEGEAEEFVALPGRISTDSIDGATWDGILTPTTDESIELNVLDSEEPSPISTRFDNSYSKMSPAIIPKALSSPESNYIDLVPRFIDETAGSSRMERRLSSGTTRSMKSEYTERGTTETSGKVEIKKTTILDNEVLTPPPVSASIFSATYQPIHSPIASSPPSSMPSPTASSASLLKRPSRDHITESPLRFLDGPTPSWLLEPYHINSKAAPSVALDQALHSPDSRSSSRTSSRNAATGESGWGSSTSGGYYSTQSNGYDSGIPTNSVEVSPELNHSPSFTYHRDPIPTNDSIKINPTLLNNQGNERERISSPFDMKEKSSGKIHKRSGEKMAPPTRGIKSARRRSSTINVGIKKMASTEFSSRDNGTEGSAEEGSIGGGYSEAEDGPAIPAQLSASDFVDAYGAFTDSPSPSLAELSMPEDLNSTTILPASLQSISHIRYDSTISNSPYEPHESLLPSNEIYPSSRKTHSRSSSTDMMDDLDAQIEEAIANFAHHGITPASPTGPISPPIVLKRTSKDIHSVEPEEYRRPSLGLSSHTSEEEIFHDLNSSREFDFDPNKKESDISPSIGFQSANETTGEQDLSNEITPKSQLFPSTIQLIQDLHSPTSGAPKLDAKARAMAFVADLRKARAMAAAEEALQKDENSVHSRRSSHDAVSMRQGSNDSGLERRSSIGSRSRVGSATILDQGVGYTLTEMAEGASRSTPSLADTLSIGLAPVDSKDFQSVPPSASNERFDPSPERLDLSKFTRTRALPVCARYNQIRKIKTSKERGRAYATRINALALEDSGLSTILAVFTGTYSSSPASPDSSSPSQSIRHGREESAFPVRKDATKATQINRGLFSPQDLIPSMSSMPYPGAGSNSRHGYTSSISSRYSSNSILSIRDSKLPKHLFSSLGRKGSKRAPSIITSPIGVRTSASPIGIGRSPGSSHSLPISSRSSALIGPRSPSQSIKESPSQSSREERVDSSALLELQALLPQGRAEDLMDSLKRGGTVLEAVNIWIHDYARS